MKKAKINCLIFLSCLFFSSILEVQGQDSIAARYDINTRTLTHVSNLNSLGDFAFKNSVANSYFQHSTSYTELKASLNYRDEEKAIYLHEGNKNLSGDFDVHSYLRLNNTSSAFAGAGYNRGKKENILWNSTSDYSLLYPYIMADSIGGNLTHEQYYFYGGYAKSLNRFTFGLSADYSAKHQYRQIDPRPRNIVTDFKVELSANYRLTSSYVIGLAASASIYKQVMDVEFYNNKGANTSELLMTGLGTHYARFAGSAFTENRYKGKAFQGNLSLIPASGKGWYFTGDYSSFSVDRNLSSLNETPITNLWTQELSGNLAYKKIKESFSWGISSSWNYEFRQGTENIIDNGDKNEYLVIHEMKMYNKKKHSGIFHGVVEWKKESMRWQLNPLVGYIQTTEEYLYPKRKISSSNLLMKLGIDYSLNKQNWLFQFSGNFSYKMNIDKNFNIPLSSTDEKIFQMLAYTYKRDTENQTTCEVYLRAQKKLSWTTALFASAGFYKNFHQESFRDNRYQIAVGLCF